MLKKTMDIALAAAFACSLHAQMITPSKLKFEAASIKPTDRRGECTSRSPGQYTCTGSLKQLIFNAFEVPGYQQLDSAFVQPNPAYEQLYVIVAARSKEAAANWGIPPKRNSDDHAMLRNLLIDRFKLTYHYEKKEGQGYSLTVDKSGIKPKSDPAPKLIGAPKDYVPPAVSGPRTRYPAENWMDITRANMGQFAEGLSRWVFKGIPITDETGLKDIYTFNLHYESLNYTPPAATEASEPLPTIFQALGRQGLKLTPKKVMADFLVIDHVEKSPTAN